MTQLAHDVVGSGVPVVFLHGITADRSHWRLVADRLNDRFTCVNVDLLGHGESPRTGAYDVFTQAGAVGELIGDLELDRPVLVGHSYGAFTATVGATMLPVRAVVNIDQELDTTAFKERVAPYETRLRGDDFAAAFDEFTHATLGFDKIPEERRAMAELSGDPDIVLSAWEAVFDSSPEELSTLVEPALQSYTVPYLAIFGNPITADERRVLAHIPNAQIEEWAGLGHFVQLVDPERTAARIAAFVETLPA